MIIRAFMRLYFLCMFCILMGCGSGDKESANAVSAQIDCSQIEADMDVKLTEFRSSTISEDIADFTYSIIRSDGKQYTFQSGGDSLQTIYESGSSSKLPAVIMILRAVEASELSLESHPQDFIEDWPIKDTDPLYEITLRHLLSFTSGLAYEPSCEFDPEADFFDCVHRIGLENSGNGIGVGTQYRYGTVNLQVAGLMAINALQEINPNVKDWQDVFTEFKNETGLFETAVFDITSASNPLLGGGMHFNGEEYLEFFQAIKDGWLISSDLLQELVTDQIAKHGAKIAITPLDLLNEDWHYGFGVFIECESASFQNCVDNGTVGEKVSCPGVYGFYPYWDRKLDYIGIVSRQGPSLSIGHGINIERQLRPFAHQWVTCQD